MAAGARPCLGELAGDHGSDERPPAGVGDAVAGRRNSSVKHTRWSRERPGAGEVRHGRRRGGVHLHGTAQDELLDRVPGQMKPLATSS